MHLDVSMTQDWKSTNATKNKDNGTYNKCNALSVKSLQKLCFAVRCFALLGFCFRFLLLLCFALHLLLLLLLLCFLK